MKCSWVYYFQGVQVPQHFATFLGIQMQSCCVSKKGWGLCFCPFHGSHCRGDWKWATFFHLAMPPYLSTYSLWWCFWRLNSAAPGTVCTYICRNNVYVSRNRHFLKAVHLKVKLIEPIFSTRLLTLLMCMLNRRSQIWISLAEARVGKWLYSELAKSCQLKCSC